MFQAQFPGPRSPLPSSMAGVHESGPSPMPHLGDECHLPDNRGEGARQVAAEREAGGIQ